jgi:hypothetical protein
MSIKAARRREPRATPPGTIGGLRTSSRPPLRTGGTHEPGEFLEVIMKQEKIVSAADRLLEVKRALIEAGVAPNGRFVRTVEDLHADLDLFARFVANEAL